MELLDVFGGAESPLVECPLGPTHRSACLVIKALFIFSCGNQKAKIWVANSIYVCWGWVLGKEWGRRA